jgi:hypothetical protein
VTSGWDAGSPGDAGEPLLHLAFTTPARTVALESCSEPLVVEVRDGDGTPRQVAQETPLDVVVDPAGGVTLHADPACNTPLTLPVVAPGSSSASFRVKGGTVLRAVTLRLSAAGFTATQQGVTLVAGAPHALAFSPGSVSLGVDTCSGPEAVVVMDRHGNETRVGSPLTLTLTPTDTSLTLHPGDGCAQDLGGGLVVGAGESRATFRFKGTLAGVSDLVATAEGLQQATLPVTLTPGAAVSLAFLTESQAVRSGHCTGALRLATQDPWGNLAPPSSDLDVVLAADPADGARFFALPGCSGAIVSVGLDAAHAEVDFYAQGRVAGAVSVTARATLGGLPVSASQSLTVSPGDPATLAVDPPSLTVPAGDCSPPITVTVQDLAGNPTSWGSARVVSLAAQPPLGVTFHADANCDGDVTSITLGAADTSGVFRFRATHAVDLRVTASASGVSSALHEASIQPAPAAALAFVSAPFRAVLGACAGPVVVETRDPWGNPSSVVLSTTVALAASGAASLELYADSACGSPATEVTVPPGQARASLWFRGLGVGQGTIQVGAQGFTGASQTQDVAALVLRGACDIPTGALEHSCPVSPAPSDASRAMLVYQAGSGWGDVSQNTRCRLAARDTITCDRMTTTGEVQVRWQVVDFPSGVLVHHLTATCNPASHVTTMTLPAPVDAARSFVLFGNKRLGGVQDATSLRRAVLRPDGTAVDVTYAFGAGDACERNETALQVVQVDGAQVTRGQVAMGSVTSVTVGGTELDFSRTALLYSYTSDQAPTSPSTTRVCALGIRGELGVSGITFSRAADSACSPLVTMDAIAWELVRFPVGTLVQQAGISMEDHEDTGFAELTLPVRPDTTLVLAGGQWTNGQAMGEGASTSERFLSDVTAWFDPEQPDATGMTTFVNAERFSTDASARWTVFVVDFSGGGGRP